MEVVIASIRENGGNNIHNRGENKKRSMDHQTASNNLKMTKPSSSRPNNVLIEKNNNIARKSDASWQTRSDGKWQNIGTGIDTRKAKDLASGSQSSLESLGSQATQQLPSNADSGNFSANHENVDLGGLQNHQAGCQRGDSRSRMHGGGGDQRLRRR